MKKNYAIRIAALVLMCTIITACFAGTTFAKYTSSGSGTGEVQAALWSVKVGNVDIATDNEFELKLADATIYPGYHKDDVATLTITNKSGVKADYAISIELLDKDTGNRIENLTLSAGADLTYTDVEPEAVKNIPLALDWPYSTNDAEDAEDTADGIAQHGAIVKVTVTATQAASYGS